MGSEARNESAPAGMDPARGARVQTNGGGLPGHSTSVGSRRKRDFTGIAGAALVGVDAVLQHWLPGGRRQGREYVARNPTRPDADPGSFKVNLGTGAWADFATGAKGRDLVSLVAMLEGYRNGEAADKLAAFLGMATEARGTLSRQHAAAPPPAPAPRPVLPVPDDAPPAPDRHPTRGLPSKTWTYRDAAGAVLCHVCRFDKADGGKDVLPLSLWPHGGGMRWEWKGCPEPRPLYGLDRLAAAPDAVVIVCEGEKAADAAGSLSPTAVAITSPSGAQSAGKADWSPLAGRECLIWPDADKAGQTYAEAVAARLTAVGAARVALLRLDALAAIRGELLPAGWDAADALAEGIDPATIAAALADPANWMPPPADHAEGVAAMRDAGLLSGAGDAGAAVALIPRFISEDGAGRRHAGVYFVDVERDKSTGTESYAPPAWICSPLAVAAMTRNAGGGDWGRLLVWHDRDGREHRWAMPMDLLASSSGDELRAALLRGGLGITSHSTLRRRLADFIQWERPEVTARCVDRTGWHGRAFVLPGGVLGGDRAEPVVYQSPDAAELAIGTAGTLDDWRDTVAAACAGHSRLVFSLSVAFAAPCLALAGMDGAVLHWRGASSTGKSTALKAAASVYGPPEFVRTWRATDNGLEGVAALHSDLLLCLDELGEANPKVAGPVAYMLANGTGKSRARRDGSTRHPMRWRVLGLSTGEIGLADLIAEAGGRTRAGQEVRVVDIPADAGAGAGLLDALPAGSSAGAFADRLREQAAMHYGHAGRAFLERLAADPAQATDELKELAAAFAAELAPANAAGQVRRVAARFALIAAAGELATAQGLTGWPAGEAQAASARCFADWLAARGTSGAREPAAMLAQVRQFIEAHGEARFSDWHKPDSRVTVNRAGFRRIRADNTGTEYFILPGVFQREVCAGFDHRAVAAALLRAGALVPDGDGKHMTRKERLPEIGPTRCYMIGPAIWEAGE